MVVKWREENGKIIISFNDFNLFAPSFFFFLKKKNEAFMAINYNCFENFVCHCLSEINFMEFYGRHLG